MELIIDNRERDLLELLNVEKTCTNLDLGDIVLKHDGILIAVIERKTWTDLAASIKDGRYHKQKKALLENYDCKNIYYVIEGPGDFSMSEDVCINGIDKNTLLSCIYNTSFRDKIQVFRTSGIRDTCNFIVGLINRVKEHPEKYCSGDVNKEEVVKHWVVETSEQFFMRALCQIPGVSVKSAKAICEVYETLPAMTKALRQTNEKLKLLKEITTLTSKGTKRKLADNVCKKIIEFIVGNEQPTI